MGGFFPSVEWVEEIAGAPPGKTGPPGVNRDAKQEPLPTAYQALAQPQYQPHVQQPIVHQQQPAPPPAASSMRRCKALFPMDPQGPNELRLQVGDIILIEKEADGWYLGTNTRGERGIFPASFVVLE